MGPSRHHVRAIVTRGDFRRLLTTRVTSQFADGVFQAGLAGAVLFNPERQTQPLAMALGFAVLLLPYSLVGPFAGVLLDRWSRRTVLVVANLVRCALIPPVALLVWNGSEGVLFLLLGLVIIGVNRFVLAGLSASLPHVTDVDHLATANAMSTTSGAFAFSSGIGASVGLTALLGTGNHGYALVSLVSVLGYSLSSAIAAGFPRGYLGPDATERDVRASVVDVARGMVLGCKHLLRRRSAGNALLAITAHRLFAGIYTIGTLLLYRNYYTGGGFFPGGAAGLGQVFVGFAVGAFLAAVVTPMAIRRWSPRVWVTTLLLLTGVTQIALGGLYLPAAMLPGAVLTGLGAQGIKIVVDTTVQFECDDEFQGRVFSVYDTMFNLSFVAGMLFGAITLPITGKSVTILGVIAAGYVAIGVWYAWVSARWPGRLAQAIHEPAVESHVAA